MQRGLRLVYCMLRGHFYAVRVGRRPGIYQTWEEAKSQVLGFPSAEHHKFTSFSLAFEYLQVRYALSPIGSQPTKLPYLVDNDETPAQSNDPVKKLKGVEEIRNVDSEDDKVETEKENPGKVRMRNIHTLLADGGARGNPGPAGSGYVIYSPKGEKIAEGAVALPHPATNNEAEYSALLYGLQKAVSLRIPKLRVLMDSQLVVYQIKGKYRTSSPNLVPLHEQVKHEIRLFEKFSIVHIPREQNQEADALANQAMDEAAGVAPPKPS